MRMIVLANRMLCPMIALLALVTVVAPCAAVELSDAKLFDPNHIVDIKIDIAEEAWATLCNQSRDFATAFSDPSAKPYSYVQADVTIDGVKVEKVGVRKKGFIGSQDSYAPSLKIKFDEYVKGQEPISGLDRLTLNNNKQDESLLSQALTYQLFREAGIHAPRCNYAKVTVNGNDLGIYSHVESVRKPMLKSQFGDDSGNLYEGTLADFYPKAIERLEAKTNTKKNDRAKVARLAELLVADEPLSVDAIGQLVDVENFLRFWAIESLIGFWDGYTNNQNNYFVYDDPKSGKLFFLPWGADSCFGDGRGPFGRFGGGGSDAVYGQGMLANRLFHADGIAEKYREVMTDVLAKVWKEDVLLAEVDRIEKLLVDQVGDDQQGAFHKMDDVRQFLRNRRKKIERELGDWANVEIADHPRKPMYTVDVGTAKGSFATVWHEGQGAPETSQGTIALMLDGEQVSLNQVSVDAQPAEVFQFGPRRGSRNAPPPASIVFRGIRESDNEPVTLTFTIPRDAFGKTDAKGVKLQGSLSSGNGSQWDFRNRKSLGGTLTLSDAGLNDSDPVSGEFDAKIFVMRGGFMDRR